MTPGAARADVRGRQAAWLLVVAPYTIAVTIALLFWGWLWGAIGLILAIPITATIKVICDHVDGWEPIGHWLGA